MSKLIIKKGTRCAEYCFEGSMPLSRALEAAGFSVAHPCGGRGVCHKCAVELSGNVSEPDIAEQKAGCRLSCRAVLLGDAEVVLPGSGAMQQIETDGSFSFTGSRESDGSFGAAVDIGTTTIALKLFDLNTGAVLGSASAINPQTAVAADVMSRIGASMAGERDKLRELVCSEISALLASACKEAGRGVGEIKRSVITGNTTMLYLLTGRNPERLSHFPFDADCLFGFEEMVCGAPAYLPACMNAFVGADITCAVLASGMTEKSETALLCDIGTNGEIALWKNGVIYVTSTAAGPAFEGAGISSGCGSIPGAIDKVKAENGAVSVHTIGEAPPVGICGSGLIDAIDAFLELGLIDETGAVDDDYLPLSNGVNLIPGDVRAVQLAKAAIAAGIQTLMSFAEVSAEEIACLYIAGGFGSHLNVHSTVNIGLLPAELEEKVKVIGNAALAGAAMMLLDPDAVAGGAKIAGQSQHINLGGNPEFNNNYMEQMLFPERD